MVKNQDTLFSPPPSPRLRLPPFDTTVDFRATEKKGQAYGCWQYANQKWRGKPSTTFLLHGLDEKDGLRAKNNHQAIVFSLKTLLPFPDHQKWILRQITIEKNCFLFLLEHRGVMGNAHSSSMGAEKVRKIFLV